MLQLLPQHIGIQKNANVVEGYETCGTLPLNLLVEYCSCTAIKAHRKITYDAII